MNTKRTNPFLTNEVFDFSNHSRISYLDGLARKQMSGSPSTRNLQDSRTRHTAQLDKFWSAALQAAFTGDINNASLQLAYMVTWWGLFKVDQDLLDANGMYLDPADPDTANDFDLALEHQIVFWATELQNKWVEGNTHRQTDQVTSYTERNTQLYGVYHQMVLDQGTALNQAHTYNDKYAEKALEGIRQASESARSYAQGVEKMYAHGEHVMNAAVETQHHMAQTLFQNLPREMEEAQARIERRKLLTRGIVASIIILAILVLPILAYGLYWLAFHIH